MNTDNIGEIYCPRCFQPMEICDGERGYACYCNRQHINENNELVNVGCWHEIPNWYLKKTEKGLYNE